jgi:aryl-alcohol dehydrogenase-like predicted oxidoreductase
MPRLDGTDLEVFPLCLGGNIFAWTASEQEAFAVLDAYADAGGNLIDTADAYCFWIDNGTGGESEEIIGRWRASRGKRGDVFLVTKIGQKPDRAGLSASNVRLAAEESLRRLQTDHVDLYFAHIDDEDVPLEETLGAFGELIEEGKVRHLGASNFTAPRLAEALAVSDREGLPRLTVVQPHYNLVHRDYQHELGPLCAARGLAAFPTSDWPRAFSPASTAPGRLTTEVPAPVRPAPTSTSAGSQCWRRSMTSRPRMQYRLRLSPSRGSRLSRRWLPRLPARERRSSSRTCFR